MLTDADLDAIGARYDRMCDLAETDPGAATIAAALAYSMDVPRLLAAVRRGHRIEAAARRVDAWMAQDRYTQLEKVDGGFDLRAALAEEPDEFRAALMEVTLQGRDIRVHWWHPDGYGARDNDGCLDT
jgi:hypothetical protein